MFFRGIFEELMFFIRGNTNTKILEEKGVKIWKDNTTRTFLDNVGLNHYQEGDMGPMYGYQLRSFNAEYKGCNKYHIKRSIFKKNYYDNI
jgi:thymidylate synthase